MIEIFLIRHGQASFGAENYDRLSTAGIEQSRLLGAWLRREGIRFDAAYCGERERQRDTAIHAFAAAGDDAFPLNVDPSFNELDAERLLRHAIPFKVLREPSLAPMLLDMKSNKDTFRRLFTRVIDEWVQGHWNNAGIGDWSAFSSRVTRAIGALARDGAPRRVAVFTSGGPITAALRHFGGDDGKGLDWRIANTSITRIARTDTGELEILERGALPHLDGRSDLVTHL